jgi:hypothetical protein
MRGTLMLGGIEWVHRHVSWIINCIPSFRLLKNISLFLSLYIFKQKYLEP